MALFLQIKSSFICYLLPLGLIFRIYTNSNRTIHYWLMSRIRTGSRANTLDPFRICFLQFRNNNYVFVKGSCRKLQFKDHFQGTHLNNKKRAPPIKCIPVSAPDDDVTWKTGQINCREMIFANPHVNYRWYSKLLFFLYQSMKKSSYIQSKN